MKMDYQAEVSQMAIDELKQELKTELKDDMKLLFLELKETLSRAVAEETREGNGRTIPRGGGKATSSDNQHQNNQHQNLRSKKQTSPDLVLKMFG